LATNRTTSLVAGGDAASAALTSGYRLAFLIASGLVAVAVAVAALVLEPVAQRQFAEDDGELAELPEPAFSSEAA
jgi:hypothetical protein